MQTFLVLLVLLPSLAIADKCDSLYTMSDLQLKTLAHSYQYGLEYDMGYSLAAIAWQESNAGKYPVNVNDPSFGVHHILLNNAMKRSKTKNTAFNRNLMAASLLNPSTSAKFAIKELQYWHKYWKGNWIKIWASYNAGHSYKIGLSYAYKIKEKVALIKNCLIEIPVLPKAEKFDI